LDVPLVVYVAVVLAWLPLAMILWNLLLFRRFARGLRVAEPVSVLVPARNEASRLPGLLGDLAAQQDVELEIIVLDDASTDSTATLVHDRAAGDPRFRLVSGTGPPPGWNRASNASMSARDNVVLPQPMSPVSRMISWSSTASCSRASASACSRLW